MTSRAFSSFFNSHLHSIRTLNSKSNPKQTQPKNPTLLLVTKKPPQKAQTKNNKEHAKDKTLKYLL
jgi:hypothetical protein